MDILVILFEIRVRTHDERDVFAIESVFIESSDIAIDSGGPRRVV